MSDIKNLHNASEGTISVDHNSTLTPTTHEPIEQLDSSKWAELNTTNLHNQRFVLLTRLSYAINIGHVGMIQQLQQGIASIEALIQQRPSNTEG